MNENVKTITDALDDAVWIEQIKLAIEKANDNPKVCLNNAFKVQKIHDFAHQLFGRAGLFNTYQKDEEASGGKGLREAD